MTELDEIESVSIRSMRVIRQLARRVATDK